MSDNNCCAHDTCCEPPAIDFTKISGKPAALVTCADSEACGCSRGVPVFDGVDPRYLRILWIVIGINGTMFLVEMIAGQLGASQALKADALDFLGDTVTYGLSLAVIGSGVTARATAALVKGLSLSLMALWVFGSTVYHTLILGNPSAEVMGGIGLLALAANRLVTVAPDPGLPAPVVATAWTWRLVCNGPSAPVVATLQSFIDAHAGKGPQPPPA